MAYTKTLYHKYLEWQLARVERKIEWIDKMLKIKCVERFFGKW